MPKENPDPCPLCDGLSRFYPAMHQRGRMSIRCDNCGLLYAKVGETRAKLVAHWNRRIDKREN